MRGPTALLPHDERWADAAEHEAAVAVSQHLDFRDYLRHHPDMAHAYDALKRQLAAQHPSLDHHYLEGKAAFIRDVLARAAAWRAPVHAAIRP